MFNIKTFNEYFKDKITIGLNYKDIAFKPFTSPPDCCDQLNCVFVCINY